jgi:tRNA dimethylallyltransferase
MADALTVLVLFGPTASGKTGILLELFNSASSIQAEVISADSMQVYRGMDIGTAKPSAEERESLPHHLIDIRDPSQQFNAGDFVRLADEKCAEIASRGRLPVVSGGTGFYLKNFILGLSEAPPSSKEIRAALKQELKEKGAAALMEELAASDPESARRIHINDEYRILRALEVFRTCGKSLSSFKISGTEKKTASVLS